jgi:HlyD family secretion protein
MAAKGKVRWTKWVTILLFLGVACGGGYWYFNSRRELSVEYQTAAAVRGDLTQAVTATGALDPVVNVQVGSQISGIIVKLYADFNSVVKSNQVIADIDPSTYKVNVLKAEADLANADANRALAQVQAERADTLFTNRLISASDHDTAVAQVLQAKAQVKSSQAALESAKVDLSRCTIYAPVDGVVISRNVDVGQTVAASFSTPTLFAIANDLSKMQIDALVSEADIGGVAIGQTVNFTVDAFPYRTFVGRLSQVRYGPITNQNVITYDCVVAVSNADLKLLPGMTANVSIITAQRNNVLKIPNAALRFHLPEPAGNTNSASPLPAFFDKLKHTVFDRAGKTNSAPQKAAQAARTNAETADGGGRGGGGPPDRSPGAAGGLGTAQTRPDRQLARTVYVLPPAAAANNSDPAKPQPVQIKIGISDGVMTEVQEGLDEGAQLLIGVISDASKGPPSNPFGGPRRF